MKTRCLYVIAWVCLSASGLSVAAAAPLTPLQDLGRQLFLDPQLSSPPGESCASCHSPDAAFTDPRRDTPTSPGAIAGRFGNRNSPTAMYTAYSPLFQLDTDGITYEGGLFWDGRAANLENQAQGPLLNPLEMANPDKATVVNKVRAASYAPLFNSVFGPSSLSRTEPAYAMIASAIAAFERSSTFSPFSSKYDAYLAGQVKLTAAEEHGRTLFNDPTKGNCAACHPSTPASDGTPPLFTDFTYDNLGVPRNPNNPFYTLPVALNPAGVNFLDLGLGPIVGNTGDNGKFKVPTLRNIALTNPYTHNGYFQTLLGVVDFYNTRDVKPACSNPMTTENLALAQGCWPQPETAATVNHKELGNLQLSSSDESDIVAFLGTLTDGYWQTPSLSECLFNWAEGAYPSLLQPARSVTQSQAPYTYRYYKAANAYVGVSSDDNHVYYLGSDGVMQDVGALPAWLKKAGCI